MHPRPGSPNRPCRVTRDGSHQWAQLKPRPWRKTAITMCWICGARKASE